MHVYVSFPPLSRTHTQQALTRDSSHTFLILTVVHVSSTHSHPPRPSNKPPGGKPSRNEVSDPAKRSSGSSNRSRICFIPERVWKELRKQSISFLTLFMEFILSCFCYARFLSVFLLSISLSPLLFLLPLVSHSSIILNLAFPSSSFEDLLGFFMFWKLNEEVRFEEYDEEGYRECEDAVMRWVKTRRKIKEREERKKEAQIF